MIDHTTKIATFNRGLRLALFPLIAAILSAALPAQAAEQDKVNFSRDVLPILSVSCFQCHGQDTNAREAELRLDVRESAVAKRDDIPAITPGKPERSGLVKRITSDDPDLRMPPAKAGRKLSAEQIATLRKWIEQGAEFSEHWSFVPPKRPPVPAVRDAAWVQSPIDNFVLSQIDQQNLKPSAKASREVLIRRATLDLLGLPPTPQEIDAFVADKLPDAYDRLIERLLASPHYGERWGRHWLDVARYADSGGFETDIFNGHAWRFRDYVIRSFNADKQYNQFIREQIAGDELFPGDKDALLATSFYTTGPVLQEAGMVPGKLEYDQLTDAADTTGSAFLGLTMGCARCHDHKYDPILQREYFGLQALFANSDHFDVKADGATVVRGRAAIKNTLAEFELEQLKERTRRETDSAKRAEQLRKIGDFYLGAAGGKASKGRNNRPQRSNADVVAAVQKYREVVARHQAEGIDVADAVVAERQKELNEELIKVGQRAVDAEPRNSETRRAFRALEIDTEMREFLMELGQKTVDAAPAATDAQTDPANNADKSAEPTAPPEPAPAGDPRLAAGEKNLDGESAVPLRVLWQREKPVEVRLLKRGELEQPGEVVEPGFPAKLGECPDLSKVTPANRRAVLADWVASNRNPLTARVIVNRIWQWHFGQGIVRTPNDFGLRGEYPTHPELLDWLAVEFMEHGWSFKHLHQLIMQSAAYQMSSSADRETLARDPENRLLTRYQPRRLEAEVIWDSVRAVSGTLDRSMFGLPIAPPLDEQEQIGNFRKWPTSTPSEANRRAIYILVRRSFRFPTLSAFDLPDNISSCPQRDVTTVPTQALTMLNNRTLKEHAGILAQRLLQEAGADVSATAALAWKYVYGRAISNDERQRIVDFIQSRKEAAPSDVGDPLQHAVEELCLSLFNTNEFIYMP